MSAKRPKRRCRWLQFSLRTLLVGVLGVSLGMSWLAVRMERVKKQEKAVEVLGRFAGIIRWDFEVSDRSSGTEPNGPPGPVWARKLLGEYFFADVEFVCLEGGDEFTDADMAHVGELRSLKSLHLGADGVTDAGLRHLGGLKELEELSLSATRVTDAGLVHLEGLSRLKKLWLSRTQVSDAGLESLKGLADLEYLDLYDVQVTPEGVSKLREALPECEIAYQIRGK